MPPARRPLSALGSLQLVAYANNPTRVITELAFVTDAQANAQGEVGQSDADTPLEVQFEEFMDGVNSRGKGTKTRQRKMTVEQAAAVLLVTVQKGHVELIAKKNDPHAIDVIKILPKAKRILAAFLPKLRGYGDIPYDQQYRGAIALAKRHFFPKGKPPTKKELMALLLQSYQEKRELVLRSQTQTQPTMTLGIQTSLENVNDSSYTGTASDDRASSVHPVACTSAAESPPQNKDELLNDIIVDVEPTAEASKVNPDPNGDSHDSVSEPEPEPEPEPVQLSLIRTPVAPRSSNPYLTPISNPRHVNHMAATPSSFNGSPTPESHIEVSFDEDSTTDQRIGELLQATATSQGRWNYLYNKFVTACQKINLLEGQKEEIQREFDITKKKLDETEQHLKEANTDKSRLEKWVGILRCRLNSIHRQLGLMRDMTDPETLDNEEESTYNTESTKGL